MRSNRTTVSTENKANQCTLYSLYATNTQANKSKRMGDKQWTSVGYYLHKYSLVLHYICAQKAKWHIIAHASHHKCCTAPLSRDRWTEMGWMTKGATTVYLMSAGDVMYEMSEQMIIIMMDWRHAQNSQLLTDRRTQQARFDERKSN